MIGNTPVYFIEELGIYAKFERNNPSGSVKDRAAYFMIKAAINNNLIKNGVIVEPTSGNTGISLSWIGKKLGLKTILTMPESMSKERIEIMRAFGADVILTPADKGMKGAIEKAKEIVIEKDAFMPNQFENPFNVLAHELTTGPEILRQTNFELDVFVAGVGTGGTISGVGRVLKKFFNKKVKIVAVEPENSAVLSGKNPGKHKIQGIGAGFIPKILDKTVIDKIETVKDEEVLDMFIYLNKKLGLNVGISAAANALVATKYKNFGKVLTVFPDDVTKYMSILGSI